MKLIKTKDGSLIEAEIIPIRKLEYYKVNTSNQFDFDWNREKKNMVFVLKSIDDETILGIISLIDFPKENRVHINLLEVAKRQRGKNKQIQNIAGCLIAYACSISFDEDYDGFVSLEPKTALLEYYMSKYGFQVFGKLLAIDFSEAIFLIKKYLRI